MATRLTDHYVLHLLHDLPVGMLASCTTPRLLVLEKKACCCCCCCSNLLSPDQLTATPCSNLLNPALNSCCYTLLLLKPAKPCSQLSLLNPEGLRSSPVPRVEVPPPEELLCAEQPGPATSRGPRPLPTQLVQDASCWGGMSVVAAAAAAAATDAAAAGGAHTAPAAAAGGVAPVGEAP